ncbi:MAG: transporter substrate-binding domain-containing protein [Ruminococcaceae bacterium]|nr:transporter substrate-binding domain-containing protein [Oscillospiraceae bacterium]
MKKVLSLVLAMLMLVTVVTVFAACGQTGNAVKVIDIKLTEEEYAFAVQKGDSELLASLNAFMDKIEQNGQFAEIINKYFGDGTPTPVTSASEMKTDGSQLIVATNAAFEPFEYKSGENYLGIDMEIMALFAADLGKELYINNMEFDAVCLAVSAQGGEYEDENGNMVPVSGGICDVAAAGLTVSEKRREILDFSDSYYDASQMLIVAADDTTFDACETAADVEAILNGLTAETKVGVQNGTTGKLYCEGDADWEFDGFAFETVGYTNGALAVQDILNGGVKYVVIDEGPAKAIVAKVNAAN